MDETQEDTTWFGRLMSNLLSYSVIILPIVIIVVSAKHKLLPRAVQSHSIIHWFVFGSSPNLRYTNGSIEDVKALLVVEEETSDRKKSSFSQENILAFIYCLFGLQFSYLIWGFLQEKIMTTKYEVGDLTPSTTSPNRMHLSNSDQSQSFIVFHDSQFLVFINRVVAFIFAILALIYFNYRWSKSIYNQNGHIYRPLQQLSTKQSAPLFEYGPSALSNILSSWCQYEALKYVNFPTQCLSKSCKVIPVMLMSKLLLNKRHQLYDYVYASLLVVGMFVFLLNQPISNEQKSKNELSDDHLMSQVNIQSPLGSGVILLALYLTFDSFTSNWQDSLYTRYDVSNWKMMAGINFYSILLTLTSLHQLGNLGPAFKLLGRSTQLMRDCMLMSIMSAVGQMFVYYTIKRFGSVKFSVIMTLRQFLSILLSCAIYGHPLTIGSTIGLLMVFGVVGFHTRRKYKKSVAHKDTRPHPAPATRFEPLIK